MQATALSFVSNLIAQLIEANQEKVLALSEDTISSSPRQTNSANIVQTSFTLDLLQLCRFLMLSAMTAPPNFAWQAWLERNFPGRDGGDESGLAMSRSDLAERAGSEGEKLAEAVLSDDGAGGTRPRLSKRNTLIKWFIDCITVGALGNTIVFLVLMGLMKGRSTEQIQVALRNARLEPPICESLPLATDAGTDLDAQETVPIIVAGYKIWPIASIISFSVVPVERRIVFLSAVGLCWGVYLSLEAAKQ